MHVTTGDNNDDTEAAAEVLRGNPPMHNYVKRRWNDDDVFGNQVPW
jgi:hypothetical protein